MLWYFVGQADFFFCETSRLRRQQGNNWCYFTEKSSRVKMRKSWRTHMRFCFELYFLGKIPLSLKPRWYYCPCSPPAAEYALALYAISDSQLSRDGLGHLLKGWIVRGTTTRIYHIGLTDSSTQIGTVPIYSILISVLPTARHWPDTECSGSSGFIP